MGILDRLSTLISSNLNAAIDQMTDPAKEIEQLILDMEEQLRGARGEVRSCLAGEKVQKKRVAELAKKAEEWEARAGDAVRAGDDNLAKEALARQAAVEEERKDAQRSADEQSQYVDQLSQALKKLEDRVKEVKSKKETLKAKARASSGHGLGTTAFDEFDRLSGKVDQVEAEAELTDELAASRHEDPKSLEVERKFKELEKGSDVEDRLAALKAKMDKK